MDKQKLLRELDDGYDSYMQAPSNDTRGLEDWVGKINFVLRQILQEEE